MEINSSRGTANIPGDDDAIADGLNRAAHLSLEDMSGAFLKAINAMVRHISAAPELTDSLQIAVDDVQQLLGSDRAVIYRFEPDWSGKVVAEAASAPQWLIGDRVVHDHCFEWNWLAPYQAQQYSAVEDVTTADITPCHAELLSSFQVRANLVVPILKGDTLWGLLIAHDCQAARVWQTHEIEGLHLVTTQVGMILQQAALGEQLQAAQADLTAAGERTRELEAANQACKQANHRLTESQQRLQLTLEAGGDGLWEWEIATGHMVFSPGWTQMLGFSPGELEASIKTWERLVHPEDWAFVSEHLQTYLADPSVPYRFDYRLQTKSGEWQWIANYGKIVTWDDQGNPTRMLGTHREISDRKQFEEKLRQSEVTTRSILTAIPDLLLRVGRDGTCHDCLPPTETDQGRLLPLHQHLSEVLPPNLLAQQLRVIAAALQANQTYTYEHQLDKEGQLCYEEVRVVPCGADECLLIVRDITHRKRTEAQLAQSEATNQVLIAALPDFLARMHPDGTQLEILSTGLVQGLLEVDQLPEDCSIFDVMPAPVAQAQVQLAQQAIETKEIQTDEYESTENGQTDYREARITSLSENTVLVMVRDISERKQADLKLQTAKAQLSGILNSSLDGIMAFRSVRDDPGQIIDFEWLLINPTACEIVGQSEAALIGQRMLVKLPGNREEGLFDFYCQVVESGQPARRQFYYPHDGIDSWFESVAVRLGDGFAVTFRDITHLKQTEQKAQQANQQLAINVDQLKKHNAEMLMLSQTSDFLQACRSVAEAYTVISTLVTPLFPNCSGSIYITCASRNRLERLADWGSQRHAQPDFMPHDCWGLRRGRLHLVSCDTVGLRCNHTIDVDPAADTLCIPMIAQGDTLGLFYLQTEPGHPLVDTQKQLAQTVAEHIGLAIANLHLRETLQNQSIRDALTGLFNRRFLEEALYKEIARAQRNKTKIGVMMLDVDHFKRFNDTYGHEAGDLVLQSIGTLLKKQIRSSDIACRYGGEELTIILPESSLQNTQIKADQIRKAIGELKVACRGIVLSGITASLGVAEFPRHGDDGAALLQAADAALYRAKATGRNQVIMAP